MDDEDADDCFGPCAAHQPFCDPSCISKNSWRYCNLTEIQKLKQTPLPNLSKASLHLKDAGST